VKGIPYIKLSKFMTNGKDIRIFHSPNISLDRIFVDEQEGDKTNAKPAWAKSTHKTEEYQIPTVTDIETVLVSADMNSEIPVVCADFTNKTRFFGYYKNLHKVFEFIAENSGRPMFIQHCNRPGPPGPPGPPGGQYILYVPHESFEPVSVRPGEPDA
jgi:hypothetical protein